MARQATIIDTVEDIASDLWDVREYRHTDHGFAVALGWPQGLPRGRSGSGGPRVVLTPPLAVYLKSARQEPAAIRLPVGSTAVKRLRAALGHHWRIDRATWWHERADDLADLTIERFADKHGVSAGAVVNARHALFGPRLRPAGWWQAPDVAALLLSPQPRMLVAEGLGISIGAVGRMRWALRSDGND